MHREIAGEAILAETSIGDNDSDLGGRWTSRSDTASVGNGDLKELELMNWLFAIQQDILCQLVRRADANPLQMNELA